MKFIFPILMMLVFYDASANEDAKEICDRNRDIARQMSTQLPAQIDPMTSFEGMSALYLNGECTIVLNYMLDESMLIEQFIEGYMANGGGKLSRSQALNHIDSNDIRQDLAQTMAGQVSDNVKEIAGMPHVTVKVIYTTDVRSIAPFVVDIRP